MKKTLLVLPLAILLANCSSTRSTTSTSSNTGINASASTATPSMNTSGSGSASMDNTGSAATGTASMGSSSSSSAMSGSGSTGMSGSSSKNWSNGSTASSGTTNWDVYDPNNYMMNPEKYRKPYELGKTGGWTYNKDWRRNTNFTADAVGEWQLELTPEVAANWMPDTRRPETYASFWTPEAVMGRYQASMAAAAKTRDSLAALTAMANANSSGSGRRKGSLKNRSNITGSASTDAGTWATGGGTTGAVGTGGLSSTANTSSSTMADSTTGMGNNSVTVPFAMTAVNGNNFMLPTLNMYIDNGSFTAFTGCNSAVGTIVVNGSQLHFEETTPSTNVECIGGFDQTAFIDRLRRADSYDVVNNQFRLKQGDQVLMVFSKNAKSKL